MESLILSNGAMESKEKNIEFTGKKLECFFVSKIEFLLIKF